MFAGANKKWGFSKGYDFNFPIVLEWQRELWGGVGYGAEEKCRQRRKVRKINRKPLELRQRPREMVSLDHKCTEMTPFCSKIQACKVAGSAGCIFNSGKTGTRKGHQRPHKSTGICREFATLALCHPPGPCPSSVPSLSWVSKQPGCSVCKIISKLIEAPSAIPA